MVVKLLSVFCASWDQAADPLDLVWWLGLCSVQDTVTLYNCLVEMGPGDSLEVHS